MRCSCGGDGGRRRWLRETATACTNNLSEWRAPAHLEEGPGQQAPRGNVTNLNSLFSPPLSPRPSLLLLVLHFPILCHSRITVGLIRLGCTLSRLSQHSSLRTPASPKLTLTPWRLRPHTTKIRPPRSRWANYHLHETSLDNLTHDKFGGLLKVTSKLLFMHSYGNPLRDQPCALTSDQPGTCPGRAPGSPSCQCRRPPCAQCCTQSSRGSRCWGLRNRERTPSS